MQCCHGRMLCSLGVSFVPEGCCSECLYKVVFCSAEKPRTLIHSGSSLIVLNVSRVLWHGGSCCFFISVACTSLTSGFCSFFEVLGTACSEMDMDESHGFCWDHFTATLASVSQEERCQQETQQVLLGIGSCRQGPGWGTLEFGICN